MTGASRGFSPAAAPVSDFSRGTTGSGERREPLADKAWESTLLSRSGEEKGLCPGGSLWVMVTHSSTLALKIPWIEEPGGLQSMGSQRVGHDWATSFIFSYNALFCIPKFSVITCTVFNNQEKINNKNDISGVQFVNSYDCVLKPIRFWLNVTQTKSTWNFLKTSEFWNDITSFCAWCFPWEHVSSIPVFWQAAFAGHNFRKFRQSC